MALISTINIGIQATTGTLTKGFAKADKAVRSFADKIKNIGPAMKASFTSALPSIGGPILSLVSMLGSALVTAAKVALGAVVALYGGLMVLGIRSVGLIGDQQDLADVLGTTQAEIAALTHAAMLGGVGAEELAGSLKKLNLNLATQPSGVKNALEQLGLSANKLLAMSPQEKLGAIGDALNKIKDPATKAAIAVDLLGKQGAALLPTLSEGSAGLANAAKEAAALGLSLSEVDARNVAQAGDNADKLQTAFIGVGNTVAAMLAPAFNDVAEKVIFLLTNTNLVKDATIYLVTAGVTGIGYMAEAVHKLTLTYLKMFNVVSRGAEKILASFEAIADGSQKMDNWWAGKGAVVNYRSDLGSRGMKEYNDKTAKLIKDSWDFSPSTSLSNWFGNLQVTARKAGSEISKANKPLEDNIALMAEARQKAFDYIDSLKAQAIELTKGKEAAKLYELSQDGVDKALLKQVEAQQKIVKQLELRKKYEERLNKNASKVFDSIATPAEKAGKELAELTELLLNGKISAKTFDKRANAINKELTGEVKFAEAAEFGSQAARSAIFRHQNKSPQIQVAQNTAALVTQGKQALGFLGKLANEMILGF